MILFYLHLFGRLGSLFIDPSVDSLLRRIIHRTETPEAGTFITKEEFIKEMEDKVGIEEFVVELKKQLNKKVRFVL
jgi:hypothetical protein